MLQVAEEHLQVVQRVLTTIVTIEEVSKSDEASDECASDVSSPPIINSLMLLG